MPFALVYDNIDLLVLTTYDVYREQMVRKDYLS